MHNECIEILLKDEEVNIDQEYDVVSDEALRPEYVGHEKEQQKNVVEVNLVYS